MVDLVGRLLIIERKDAMKWGYDPANAIINSSVEGANPVVAEVITPETPSVTVGKPDLPISPPSNSPSDPKPAPLSLLAVVVKLVHSPRALMAIILSIVFGAVWTAQETGLPLHLQAVWGLKSGTVGLVLLAGVGPTLLSSPLAGWYADVKGTEWVSLVTLIGSLPWWWVATA